MDTGLCTKVQYEVEFVDAENNSVSSSVETTTSKKVATKTFNSTQERDSVVNVRVRAKFAGKASSWTMGKTTYVSTQPLPTTFISTQSTSGPTTAMQSSLETTILTTTPGMYHEYILSRNASRYAGFLK